MAKVLDINPGEELNIIGVWTGNSFGFALTFKNDDDSPLNVPGTPKLTIYKDEARKTKALELIGGDGLTVADNVLTVFVSKAKNTLEAHKYFWSLEHDMNSTESFPSTYGTMTVNKGR